MDFSKARQYAELAVGIARRLSAEEQTTHLYEALKLLASVNLAKEALPLSEEAYELVSGVHGPEHPEVQEAASELIQYLLRDGDFSRAEDYARINYETLMSGSDPESYISAISMKQLAHIWAEKPSDPNEDPEVGKEAVRLIDRSIEITSRMFPNDTHYSTPLLEIKCDVSIKKWYLTDETREDLGTVLKDNLSVFGAFSDKTLTALSRLAEFYLRVSPFHGYREFEIATMLFCWFETMKNLQISTGENSDKKEILEKPAMLYEECITEFLDNGLTPRIIEKWNAAIAG